MLSSPANTAGYKAVIIAADKYQRLFPMLMTGAGTVKAAQHALNAVLGLAMLGLGAGWVAAESWNCFFAMQALDFVLGALVIIPIGGADMPVVVSMLNSYSGWGRRQRLLAEQRDADHRRLAGGKLGRDLS